MESEKLINVLISNTIKCLVCNKIITSKSQHNFVQCGCSNETFVDGGNLYSRVGAVDLDKIENLCKYVIMTEQEYEDMLERKRIKDEEILQKKIDAGLMINVGNDIKPHWVSKEVWDIVMKVSSKYYPEFDKRSKK